MSVSVSQLCTEFETLTDQMYELLVSLSGESLPAGNDLQSGWQTLSDMDKQRHHLLEHFFQQVAVQNLSETELQLLLQLKSSSNQFIDYCHQLKNTTRIKLDKISQQHKAANAYLDTVR